MRLLLWSLALLTAGYGILAWANWRIALGFLLIDWAKNIERLAR